MTAITASMMAIRRKRRPPMMPPISVLDRPKPASGIVGNERRM